MRIEEIKIFGFGKWRDYHTPLHTLHPNLVTGKNEAGKSTLYQFLLYILFDLPPKQREIYFPKKGGTLGGQLLLQTQEHGSVWVERIYDRNQGKAVCRTSSGKVYGEKWLENILGGTKRNEYASIFSFNSEDLTKLNNLSGDKLGETLLNVGLTGSDHIYRTEKWLEKQVEDRFKPRGKKPEINEQLQIVERLHQKIRSVENEEDHYQKLQKEKQEIHHQINRLEEEWKQRTNDLYRAQQILKARPLLIQYHQTVRELADEDIIHFPDSGVERYQHLKEHILPLESEKQLLTSDLEELHQSIDELGPIGSPQLLEEAQSLLNVRPEYEQTVYEYESSLRQSERLREQVQKDLSYMDVSLDEGELDEYPLPFYIEETWRDIKKETEKIEQEQQFLKEQEEDMDREFKRIKNNKSSIEKAQISNEKIKTYKNKLQGVYETAGSSSDDQTSQVRMKKQRLGASTAAFCSVVIGGFLQWLGSGMELLFIMLLTGTGFAYYAYQIHRKIQKRHNDSYGDDYTDHEVEEARRQIQQYEAHQTELKHLHEQWKQLNQEDIRLNEKRNNLQQREKRLSALKDEQVSHYPFLAALDVQHWEKLFHLLSQTREKRRGYLNQVEDIKKYTAKEKEIKEKLQAFYHRLDWEFNEEHMNRQWQLLEEWKNQQLAKQEQLRQKKTTVESVRKRLKETEFKLQTFEKQRDQLYNEASVLTEQKFFERSALKQKQEQRIHQKAELERQFEGMLSGDEQDDLMVQDKVPEESELQSWIERCKQDKQQLEEQKSEAQQKLADIHSAVKQMENSDERSRITHLFHLEKDKLRSQAKEWAAYQVALQSLKETKQTYKEKYLPKVLETAEEYFTKLTEGQYIHIHFPEGLEHLKIKHKNGLVYTLDELSRGTRDQLYISIRLALGVTMAETLRLPFLVDDAFVHFDSVRLQAMVQILEELSVEHQMIIFTWRSDLQKSFQSPNVLRLQ
ncbi:ATP-binding protein [Halobacillus litoralis]|uniref:ATP-binding protein n=1 Tax=Halobacillus litoralis TaxID=45668 RepID=UPI001CFE6FDD|nr:AAA family ATPase [Halobacillus litoralis]